MTEEHPAHYNKGKIEVWDFIADQALGFLEGNVVKYICRYRYKGAAMNDLLKAKAYLDRLIMERACFEAEQDVKDANFKKRFEVASLEMPAAPAEICVENGCGDCAAFPSSLLCQKHHLEFEARQAEQFAVLNRHKDWCKCEVCRAERTAAREAPGNIFPLTTLPADQLRVSSPPDNEHCNHCGVALAKSHLSAWCDRCRPSNLERPADAWQPKQGAPK